MKNRVFHTLSNKIKYACLLFRTFNLDALLNASSKLRGQTHLWSLLEMKENCLFSFSCFGLHGWSLTTGTSTTFQAFNSQCHLEVQPKTNRQEYVDPFHENWFSLHPRLHLWNPQFITRQSNGAQITKSCGMCKNRWVAKKPNFAENNQKTNRCHTFTEAKPFSEGFSVVMPDVLGDLKFLWYHDSD